MFEPDFDYDYYSSSPLTEDGLSLWGVVGGSQEGWETLTPAARRAFYYLHYELQHGASLSRNTAPILLALLRDTPTSATRILERMGVNRPRLAAQLRADITASIHAPEDRSESLQVPSGILGLAPCLPIACLGIGTGQLLIAYVLRVWIRGQGLHWRQKETVTKEFLQQHGIGLEKMLEVVHTLEAEGQFSPDEEYRKPLYGARWLFRQIEKEEIAKIEVCGILVTDTPRIESLLQALRQATGRFMALQNRMNTLYIYMKASHGPDGKSYAEKFGNWWSVDDNEVECSVIHFNAYNALDAFGPAFYELVQGLLLEDIATRKKS